MGNCTKGVGYHRDARSTHYDKYDQQPEDTELLKDQNFPELTLHGLVRKFKLKMLNPNELYRIKIAIDNVQEFLLNEKNSDEHGQIKWDIEQKFTLKCNQYELRKKYLHIDVLNDAKDIVGSIKINMYLIAVGPYHLDFEIKLGHQKRVRASFDIKIAQVVSMKIQPQMIEMYDVKQYVGDKYAYSLKTIIGNTPVSHKLSYVYEVGEPKDKEKSSGIKWHQQINSQMPTIIDSVPFYQFHYATLKIIFWKVDKIDEQQEGTQIFGQCYISFAKMLSSDSLMTKKSNKEFEIKKVELTEKLWNHGVQCGTVKATLSFQIQKHLQQMFVCVRTEKGISKLSPVFKSEDVKGKAKCKQINDIVSISERLTAAQIGLQKQHTTYSQRKACFNEKIACLEQLHKILKITNKETIKIYKYSNNADLLRGQATILSIGDRILGYMDGEYDEIENLRWKLLGLIIKRGEFSLNYIGFQNYEQLTEQEIHDKIAIALRFQQFLYKLLGLTFHILGLKRYDEQRMFAELFLAVAYFRIPQFRKRLIQLLKKPDDPDIPEWRGTDFTLTQNSEDFKDLIPGQNTYEILFDWEQYFYKYIETTPTYLLNKAHLDELLQRSEWQARVRRRRGAFFAFIKQWVGYVEDVSVRIVSSNWKHFPGYIDILRAFLVEMKLKSIKQYPSSIKLACSSLLANEHLLNIFVTIIFKKTTLSNNLDVFKILQLTSNFFEALQSRKKRIPSTFNYPFFFQGIKMIIESEYSFTIAKALSVLYEHFELFDCEFKVDLCKYLLGKIFFTLFLHWESNVRTIFHHLLIIKMFNFFSEDKSAQNHTASKEQMLQMSDRYDKLLVVLENAKKTKEKESIPIMDKDLFIKLRKDLRKKKKHNQDHQKDRKKFQKSGSGGFISNTSIQLAISETKSNQKIKNVHSEQQNLPKHYDSQMITMDILYALQRKMKNKENHKKEQVTRMAKQKNQCHQHQNMDNSQNCGHYHCGCQKGTYFKTSNSIQEIEMPILNNQDFKYVTAGMKQFSETSQQFLKALREHKEAPKIKPVMTLDSGEMAPQEYGQIEQW